MKFTMKVNMDGAAFAEDLGELPSLLQKAAGKMAAGYRRSTILDSNGNTVGEWKVTA